MKSRSNFFEKGQSIILIALMFFAMVVMLALVLDGGNIYAQKRAAQVAADAGALAGARHLCGDERNEIRAESDAIKFAEDENPPDTGVITATVTFPGDNIQVDTTIGFDPYFAQVIGFNDLSVAATAVAGCESPSTGRIMPITWFCPPAPPGEEDDDQFCFFDFPDCDPDDVDCDPDLYIFMDWSSYSCVDPPNSLGTNAYESGEVDCDWDDDDEDDAFLGESNSGWLNLNDGANSSDADLREKVFDACENQIGTVNISDHTWVPGQDGVGPPVFDAVQDYCLEKEIIIPVFDIPCAGDQKTNDPETDCQLHQEDEYIVAQGAAQYYHIIGFASFTITCVHSGPQDRVKDAITYPGSGVVADGSICDGRNRLQTANEGMSSEFGPSDPMTIEGHLNFEISPLVGGVGGVETGTYIIYLLE